MATTEHTITDANVGQVIGPADGFLVSLRMTTPPVYETPEGDDGSGVWRRGVLQLRGTRSVRDLYCNATAQNGHSAIQNHSLGYRGDLVVLACPRGGVFSLTLSDQPVVERRCCKRRLLAPTPAQDDRGRGRAVFLRQNRPAAAAIAGWAIRSASRRSA